MSRTIKKDIIINRLNNIPEFVSEYSINVNTISGMTKKATFTHRTCGRSFDMMIKSFIGCQSNPGHRCPFCASYRRILSNSKDNKKPKTNNKKHGNKNLKDVEIYIEKVNNIDGYQFIDLAETYIGNHTKAIIKHLSCGRTFIKRFSDFIYNKQYCPYCIPNTRLKRYEEAFKNFDDHGFILLDKEFKGSHEKALIQCKYCGEISERTYNNIVNLNGKCSCQKLEYKGETLIKKYLFENNIDFIHNKTFSNLKYDAPLRLDFYIESLNTIIEYDGIQHFKRNIFFNDNINDIKERDLRKNNFATENKINIIRISYKETSYKEIQKILDYILFNKLVDGKPYDGKLSRTVWVGGKSDYELYKKYNS